MHLDGVQRDTAGLEVAEQAGDGAAGALDPAAHLATVDVDVTGERAQPVDRRRHLVDRGDLEDDQVAGDLRLEVVGGVGGDDLAAVDDDDAVAQRVGLVEVVGGEEHRRPALAAQLGDVPPQVGPRLRVEAGGGLVEEDEGRVVDQPHRDVEPSLLAPRHVLGHPLPQALELQLVEELPAASYGVGLRHPVEHPVVHDLLARTGGGERRTGLRDVADRAAHLHGLLDDVVAVDRRGAGRGAQQRHQHPQRGGLAGAVGAEEADHLALGHVEVDAVDGLDVLLVLALPGVEGLHEPSCGDHRALLLSVCALRNPPVFNVEHWRVKRCSPRFGSWSTDRRRHRFSSHGEAYPQVMDDWERHRSARSGAAVTSSERFQSAR